MKTDCMDCEIRFANDNERVIVSVKPLCFRLQQAREKRAKREIKNKNIYFIYFKAITSNAYFIRVLPNGGHIQLNSKNN